MSVYAYFSNSVNASAYGSSQPITRLCIVAGLITYLWVCLIASNHHRKSNLEYKGHRFTGDQLPGPVTSRSDFFVLRTAALRGHCLHVPLLHATSTSGRFNTHRNISAQRLLQAIISIFWSLNGT